MTSVTTTHNLLGLKRIQKQKFKSTDYFDSNEVWDASRKATENYEKEAVKHAARMAELLEEISENLYDTSGRIEWAQKFEKFQRGEG